MIPHNNNGQEYLMFDLPAGSCVKSGNGYQFNWHKMPPILADQLQFILRQPTDILGLASDLTEEQAVEVVERLRDQWGFDGYKNYAEYVNALEVNLPTALESLSSLLVHHGMEGETLFLKRVK